MILPFQAVTLVPAIVQPVHPAAAPTMALPDHAYGERQVLSPIRILGMVKKITCGSTECRVEIQVRSVERNRSQALLKPGQRITVLTTAASPAASGMPTSAGIPAIGAAKPSVRIPAVSTLTQVWMRPALRSPSQPTTNLYELTAGPYGFGPNLEGLTTLKP